MVQQEHEEDEGISGDECDTEFSSEDEDDEKYSFVSYISFAF